ncbi:hypothetical protein UT300006_22580 [Clostridium sp. CTA-6]
MLAKTNRKVLQILPTNIYHELYDTLEENTLGKTKKIKNILSFS